MEDQAEIFEVLERLLEVRRKKEQLEKGDTLKEIKEPVAKRKREKNLGISQPKRKKYPPKKQRR